ncbi:MAG TPA: hypothetical protein VGG03_07190 [Thermoanaerobaculia bacterium]|jgi:hypothetical protein
MRTRIAVIALVALALDIGAASAADTAKRNEDCFHRVLLCGETIGGELTNRDCAFSDGSFGDRWFMASSEGMSVELTAATQGFTARLFLSGDAIDAQTVSPSAPAVAHATCSRPGGCPAFSALMASSPATGNALGGYSLSLSCNIARPCATPQVWHACAGYGANNPPPTRFLVQAAFRGPESGHEGVGLSATFGPAFLGTYTSFPNEGLSLVTKFFEHPDRVELRYIQMTDLSYRLAVTDRATQQTRVYRNTENPCGDDTRYTFAAAEGPGSCRQYRRGRFNPYIGCYLDSRFAVELVWTHPVSGKTGKGRNFGNRIAFTKVTDLQVFLRFVPSEDQVRFEFASLSDWAYTLKVTDTLTGEVRTYENPAGRVCAVVDPDVFGD